MNFKTFAWVSQRMKPGKKRAPLSPFARRLNRLIKIFFLLGFWLFVVWRVTLYFEINSRLGRIRAAGLPTSGTEINNWLRPVADAENGSLVLTQAFAPMRAFPDKRSNVVMAAKLLSRKNEWSAETRDLVLSYVQTNEPALKLAREAVRLPQFRYSVDYAEFSSAERPHLRQLKTLGQVAALAAGLDAESGRTNDWPALVELQLRLAATLEGEPTLMSYLVRNAIIARAALTAERCLNRGGLAEEESRNLESVFSSAGKTNGLPLALIGERAMTCPVFRFNRRDVQNIINDIDNPGRSSKPHSFSGKPILSTWVIGLFERDLNFFLQRMEKLISLAQLPPPACLAITNDCSKFEAIALKWGYPFTGMQLPLFSKAVVREAAVQAMVRLTRTALAIERFRNARGRLPKDLPELSPQFLPDIPNDPFDGFPLRYKTLPRGYVIYSIGADGHDDGGREPPVRKDPSDSSSYDLTFTVER